MHEFTKQFHYPVDLRRLLSEAGVDYLDVNDSRLVLLYHGEVIQATVEDRGDDGVRSIWCRIWVTPQSRTDDWTAFIENFEENLDRAADRLHS